MRRSSRFTVVPAAHRGRRGRGRLSCGPPRARRPNQVARSRSCCARTRRRASPCTRSATISTVWPSSPCFNNLVYFDPLKPKESADTIIGELAEKWSWQDSYRNLVFFLRKDVKWHDGKPFTSQDVKFTFDMVREAPNAEGKLRINPRKDWYANVDHIEAPDAYTVVFRLKRPQPSLLIMLASGYSPVYAAHVPPAQYRTTCVGTGPFKLKEWRLNEYIDYVKNPDYFVKGRPYVDGLRYIIINERGTRTAALQAGQLDIAMPGETTKAAAEQIKAAVPQVVVTPIATNVTDNIIMNVKKPPFDNVRGAAGRQLRHRPAGAHPGRAPGRRRCSAPRMSPRPVRRVGPAREGARSRCPATASRPT